eukprot:11406429-Ditylum_brightwellii.AAC.1
MFHLDNLLSNFMSDFDAISNNLRQLIAPTRDSTSNHDILWPRHGPDPICLIEQHDKDPDHVILWPRHVFTILSPPQADDTLPASNHPALSDFGDVQRFFDPGGLSIKMYIRSLRFENNFSLYITNQYNKNESWQKSLYHDAAAATTTNLQLNYNYAVEEIASLIANSKRGLI